MIRRETPHVHVFASTSQAYTYSQTDAEIRDADVLVVPSEQVAGVMVRAWPTAATPERGDFHSLAEGVEWSSVDGMDYSEAGALALAVAERGFENYEDLAESVRTAPLEDAS